jgi:Rhodopirellula transposase DDE domain
MGSAPETTRSSTRAYRNRVAHGGMSAGHFGPLKGSAKPAVKEAISVTDPGLVDRLEAMIDAETRGDSESPLRWTCQSTRAIAATLTRRQHPVSHTKVAQILHELDYSLQGNRKTEEGDDHPDRDAQFRYINRAVKR